MLQAQVNYWNLVEQKRHNQATEKLGFDTLEYQYADLHERTRHNQVSEQLGFETLHETVRHNMVSESQQWYSLNEQARHNRATESLGIANLNEVIRHNVVTEGYQGEANRINWANVGVAQANANTNRLNALENARKIGYDNENAQYRNRTDRIRTTIEQQNADIRRLELINKKRETNIHEFEATTKPFIEIIKGGLSR